MRAWVAFLAVVTASLTQPVRAEDVRVYGAGATPCTGWNAARTAGGPNYEARLEWVEGYVVGAATYSHATFAKTTPDSIASIVTAHCQKNPSDDLMAAAHEVVMQLLVPHSGKPH